MKGKDDESKVTGFNIMETQCIWMKAGIVTFKICNNAYDCNNCKYDKAMTAAVRAGKEQDAGGKRVRSFRDKSKEKTYSDRLCRHVLTGRVANRLCGMDYRCDICEFDQLLEDIEVVYPIGDVSTVEVAGYRYSVSYYYNAGHAWARVEYGGRVRVGIDDFAMKLLGSPDGWDLPRIGDRVEPNEPAFALKRGDHRAEFLSPVGGTLISVNRKVLGNPDLVHSDPYKEGWLFLVEPDHLKDDLEPLHFGEQGKNWLTSEIELLHELAPGEHGSIAATGAPPVDDVFNHVPEIGWERLVRTFLRT